MLEWLGYKFLSVRLWIWLYMLFGILVLGIVALMVYKEKIKSKYYKLRFPEQTIRIVIHYTGALYKEFYRIIPTDKIIKLKDVAYFYDEKVLNRHSEIFAEKEQDKYVFTLDGKKYEYDNLTSVRQKDRQYPELHYFYNNPNPMSFNQELIQNQTKITPIEKGKNPIPVMTGKQLKEFETQDFFNKLLNLREQKGLMLMLLLLTVINMLISGLIALKIFDIIKTKGGSP